MAASAMPRERRISVDIRDMRKPSYMNEHTPFLDDDTMPAHEPIGFFANWLDYIAQTSEILFEEANATVLCTATRLVDGARHGCERLVCRDGLPSCRMVLLKGFSEDGFSFYTNYDSRKGAELAENPNAAMMFYWARPNRSVRIEGVVDKLPAAMADAYWTRRPRLSQLSAACSPQSSVVPSRQYLTSRTHKLAQQLGDEACPKPDNWGGYILRPTTMEFWQGQTDRLHDRIRFRKRIDHETLGEGTFEGENGWIYERLAP